MEGSGCNRARHQQANDPVEFAQDAGVEAQIIESADRNLNTPGKIAGCHAVLQGKTLLRTDTIDGFGAQVGVMLDETLIEITGLKLMLR